VEMDPWVQEYLRKTASLYYLISMNWASYYLFPALSCDLVITNCFDRHQKK